MIQSIHPSRAGTQCMWLEKGDESQRCPELAAWTYGIDGALYCTYHGEILEARCKRSSAQRGRDDPRANHQRRGLPTETVRRLLVMLRDGYSQAETARRLGCAEQTVSRYAALMRAAVEQEEEREEND